MIFCEYFSQEPKTVREVKKRNQEKLTGNHPEK
jgi:hypothetical protein